MCQESRSPSPAQAAIEKFGEALAVFRELDEPVWEGIALRDLGIALSATRDHAAAVARHEEALAVWRRLNHLGGVPAALKDLAHEMLHLGDYARAAALYRESLMGWSRLREPLHIGGNLRGLARMALATGQAEGAGRLLGAVGAFDEAMSLVPPPEERDEQEGRTPTFDTVVATGLAVAESAAAPSPPRPGLGGGGFLSRWNRCLSVNSCTRCQKSASISRGMYVTRISLSLVIATAEKSYYPLETVSHNCQRRSPCHSYFN